MGLFFFLLVIAIILKAGGTVLRLKLNLNSKAGVSTVVAAGYNLHLSEGKNLYDHAVWLLKQLRSRNLTHGIALVSGAHSRN